MSEKAGETRVVLAALDYALNPLKYGQWGLGWSSPHCTH